ncbi:MAG: aminoglycoside phosphotransferase family protein [Deltaproteobacteria bacterium]|nr:aminoglycoside phosphotransferase family protein [Deltaproteobacteria bacterium]
MLIDETLPVARRYLEQLRLPALLGWDASALAVKPLAQGEYNMNYRVRAGARSWVFRVNVGTQIGRDDQILYEYRTLCALAKSGVTPVAHYVDNSRREIAWGVLLMDYLPGEPLNYHRDLEAAGRLFARIHELKTTQSETEHLIAEERPLRQTLDECRELLAVYQGFAGADPDLRALFDELLAWADEAAAAGDAAFAADPWRCVINTEVNSGNFIANREAGTLHLIDWEKALLGDPSQDLSHFAVPTTTLWKTDVRLDASARRRFLDAYRSALVDRHLADTIVDRVARRDPFNCLRGISWSAMAWVRYQSGEHALKNADTFRTITRYLEPAFLRALFAPYAASLWGAKP